MLLICNIETPTRKHMKQQRKLVERNVTFLQVILQVNYLNRVLRQRTTRAYLVYLDHSSYPHAENSTPMKLTELSASAQLEST